LTLGWAVWEPWATTITPHFTFGVPCFSVCFPALTFQQQKYVFHKIDLQKDSQIHQKPDPVPIFADFLHSLFLMACAMVLIDLTASTCYKTHKKQNKNKALKRHRKNTIIS
jgi:hypothetical protein